MSGSTQILIGDCVEEMAKMPADSVDAVVCDPPYELSSGKPRVGYENCLRWILLNVSFPNLHKPDTKNLQAFNLAGVLTEAPLLSGIHGAVGVGARVNMPIGAVDFEDGVQGREVEITDEGEASATVPEGELPDVLDAECIQLHGDYILQLRGASHLAFCKGTCSCYRQLGAGRVGVPVVILCASLGDSLDCSTPPSCVSLGADGVGLQDDTLGNADGASGVVALPRTELPAMLALDCRRGTCELLPASGTGEAHFRLELIGSEGVGAGAGTGSFTAPLEASNSGEVSGGANRANPLGRVLIHRKFSAYLKGIVPQKGFMGKVWDGNGVAFSVDMWQEAYRVLKPGGFLLSFGGTRRYHRMASAIEDAGFDLIDSLLWIQGAGFPKSLNVEKQLTKMQGEKRRAHGMVPLDGPESARIHRGRGTSLKPAHEPIVMARKPLSETSVARNVLRHLTGALNIDGCRVGSARAVPASLSKNKTPNGIFNEYGGGAEKELNPNQGRWPPNLLLSHVGSPNGCKPTGEVRRVKPGNGSGVVGKDSTKGMWGVHSGNGHLDPDGTEPQEVWICHESCPIRLLDEQSGPTPSGGKPKTRTRQNGAVYSEMAETVNYQPYPDTMNGGAGPSRFFPRFEGEPELEKGEQCVHGSIGWCPNGCGVGSPEDVTNATTTEEPSSGTPLIESSNATTAEHSASGLSPEAPFRYVAKASRRERNAGLEGMPEKPKDNAYGDGLNSATKIRTADQEQNGVNRGSTTNGHPTVKPIALMRWLVRLVTPPGGTVLDPFVGSGSTGCAAAQEGFNFIGIEQDSDYALIAEKRISYWANGQGAQPEKLRSLSLPHENGKSDTRVQGSLFDEI